MKQALAALLFVTALSAAPVSAQTNPTTSSGVVVSSTTDSLVIRLDDGTQRTFRVDTTTTLPSERLTEGKRITVRYQPVDGGLFRAETVTLMTVDRPMASSTPTDRATATDPPATTDTTRTTNDDDDDLPATASPMPLLALAGVGGLLSALALSKARRNS